MIGFGKVWKSVTGGAATQAPLSTIPRDVTAPKPVVTFEPHWDPADIVPSETRTADRFVPFSSKTVLTTTSGKRIAARIINVSRMGVAVEAGCAIDAQDVAMVGSRPVTPGRRIALGMVFLFKKPLDPKTCSTDIIL